MIDPSLEVEKSFVDFPWNKIVGEEVKIISKVNGTLSQRSLWRLEEWNSAGWKVSSNCIESEGIDRNIFAAEGMSCCLDQIFLFDPTLTVC